MAELIWAVICGVLTVFCLAVSVMSYREKGFLFNNLYIWASKKERETMDKKPAYRQSAMAFAFTALVFFFMALACIFHTYWLWGIVGALSIALLVYAIGSSAKGTN